MTQLAEDIAAVVHREVKLLDARDYKGWLGLYDDPCHYWIPASHKVVDTNRHVSLVNDDRHALEERVKRLGSRFAYAQSPPSRTVRAVSNLVVATPDSGHPVEVSADCVLMLAELRFGEQSLYPARCDYTFRRHGAEWRIASKTVWLLAAEEPLREIAFVL